MFCLYKKCRKQYRRIKKHLSKRQVFFRNKKAYFLEDDFLLERDFAEQDFVEEVFFDDELQEQVELQFEPYN